jgi:hypothetical protein
MRSEGGKVFKCDENEIQERKDKNMFLNKDESE